MLIAIWQRGACAMASYYCLLLDQDGTIFDFEAAEDKAIHNTLQQFGLPVTQQAIQKYKSINSELWASLEKGEIRQEKLVVKRFEKLLNAFQKKGDAVKMNDFYLTSLSKDATLIDGVESTLKDLGEVATLAVVTNGVEKVQKARIKAGGLGNIIDEIFTSERVGVAKPARKIFDTALRSLGIENRKKVLVVGDSLKADIQGGKAAGLATCYCNFKNEPLPENAPKPDYIIYHFEELLSIVMQEEELENARNPQKRHQVQLGE